MTYSLVGSRGAVSLGYGVQTPAWGAGEARTAGNLLVCWAASYGASGATIPTPTDWTKAIDETYPAGPTVAIFTRIATGGDTAPSVGVTTQRNAVALAEFAGPAVSPLDRTGAASALQVSPVTATAAGTDDGIGELVLYGAGHYSQSLAVSSYHSVNNSDEHDSKNDSDVTVYHYNFGWGVTTDNATADVDVFATTDPNYIVLAFATFKTGITNIDAPTLRLNIAETLVEYWDNRNYEDAPELKLNISAAANDVYPNYRDTPSSQLKIAATITDTFEFVDTPQLVIAITMRISEFQIAEHLLSVRERPPLRLALDIATPDGGRYRWAIDEFAPQDRPISLGFSSTMPGGFEQLETTLARAPQTDYRDLAEFSTITVRSPGGHVVWQGRLETAPRTSGDQMAVSPGAVGWQAALDDRKDVQMVYVDRQMSGWQGASVQRRINYLNQIVDLIDGSVTTDESTGYPALAISFQGSWSRSKVGEAWYDAKGVSLGSIYAAWRANDNVGGSGWGWGIALSDDDVAAGSAFNYTALTTASPSAATVTATTNTRTWACAHFECVNVNNNEDGKDYTLWFTVLAVYGNHGLTTRGTNSYTDAQGLYASDIVAHAIATWAPELAFTTGTDGTIQTSDFVVPHASYLDATTASQILRDVTKYGLEDWAVWEGPTFYWAPRNYHGRTWRATIGPSGLSEQGPQVDRLWNSVIVAYTDVTGKQRTTSPIQDPDPLNPVTVAGLTRRTILKMGTSTDAAATQVGQIFLNEQKLLSTAGEAKISGYVADNRGVMWPASYIRAGDQISFIDASDSSYRRIVKASWDNNSKVCQISLDSPAEGLQALLERLGVVLIPIGFS